MTHPMPGMPAPRSPSLALCLRYHFADAGAEFERITANAYAKRAEDILQNPDNTVEEFENALALTEEVLTRVPLHVDALTSRATALYKLNRFEDAIIILEIVSKLATTISPQMHFYLGHSLVSLGEIERDGSLLEQAKNHLYHALDEEDCAALAHSYLGVLWAEEDPDQAKLHFNASISKAPYNYRVLLNYGSFLARKGDFSVAAFYMQEAYDLQSDIYSTDAVQTLNNLLNLYLAAGENEEAESCANTLLRIAEKYEADDTVEDMLELLFFLNNKRRKSEDMNAADTVRPHNSNYDFC